MRTNKKPIKNKNRSWDEPVNAWVIPTRFATVIVAVLLCLVVHAVLQHSCRALNQEIARMEADQRVLADELKKERARWGQMKAPASLSRALNRHGIAMQHPAPSQMVHVNPIAPMPGARHIDPDRPTYAAR